METPRKPRPRVRILIGAATALGPGKVDLFEAIAETGSISAAARAMGMSYRRAWLLVYTMNRCFHGNLVTTVTGACGAAPRSLTSAWRSSNAIGKWRRKPRASWTGKWRPSPSYSRNTHARTDPRPRERPGQKAAMRLVPRGGC